MGDRWKPETGQQWLRDTEKRMDILERRWITSGTDAATLGNIRYGTILGVTAAGVQVVLDDGFGTIDATSRNPRYYPVIGDRVLVERSGGYFYIQNPLKPAKAARLDLMPYLTANWTRYNTEGESWSGELTGPFQPPVAFRTSNGIVHLEGLVRKWQGGAFTSPERVMTLPVNFRPDYPCWFATQGSTGGTIAGAGRALVLTNGEVWLYDVPADSSFVNFEHISFPVGLTWTDATLLNGFTAFTAGPTPPGGVATTFPLPGYALDSNGITWTRGGVQRVAGTPADSTVVLTYPIGLGPILSSQTHWIVAGHTTVTRGYASVGVGGTTNRNRTFRTGPGGTNQNQMLDGTPFLSESTTLAPYGATTAQPVPGIFGAVAYSSANYWLPRAYLTPEGMVHLAGLNATPAATTGTVGWLAPELRPLYRKLFGVFSGTTSGRIDVQGNGKVLIASATASSWVSVDNVLYMADAGAIDQTWGA